MGLTRSLGLDCSLCSRPPLRSPIRSLAHFAHSLPCGTVNDWIAILSAFFLFSTIVEEGKEGEEQQQEQKQGEREEEEEEEEEAEQMVKYFPIALLKIAVFFDLPNTYTEFWMNCRRISGEFPANFRNITDTFRRSY